MPGKRMLIVPAELVRKIDENRGDTTQAEFLELLINSQLEQGAEAMDEKKYVTKEELRLFKEDVKQFLKSFLGCLVSYGLESNKESIKTIKRLYKESQLQLESPEQPVTESEKKETTDYEVAAELEILPPLDMDKITRTMIYLESLPEVETVELVPLADKPLVIVILRRPIHLIEILKTLPEVSQADVVTEGKLIKIEMKLAGNTVLDEVKEGSDSKACGKP